MLLDSKNRVVRLTKREATDYQLAQLREVLQPEEALNVSGFFALAERARFITFTQKQSAFANKVL